MEEADDFVFKKLSMQNNLDWMRLDKLTVLELFVWINNDLFAGNALLMAELEKRGAEAVAAEVQSHQDAIIFVTVFGSEEIQRVLPWVKQDIASGELLSNMLGI